MPPLEMHKVIFSPDRKYRYWLGAKRADGDGVCLFLMLNPSEADEQKSDHTITKCKGFVRRWGYGTLWVCNLFAIRSPDPAVLKKTADPVGPMNDNHILEYARRAHRIVCAWGDHGAYLDRDKTVLRMLEDNGLLAKTYHLGLTDQAQPKHPARLSYETPKGRFQGRSHVGDD